MFRVEVYRWERYYRWRTLVASVHVDTAAEMMAFVMQAIAEDGHHEVLINQRPPGGDE